VPLALLTFNLGVEAGQLAVLAVVLPLILVAKRRAWFEQKGVKALSAAIAAAGLFWFVTRVFGLEIG
jgi:NAD(P)H-dependent FMN reductase